MKRLFALVMCLGLVACTASQEALLLNVIITAASSFAAADLPPADAPSILAYRSATLNVVDSLLNDGMPLQTALASLAAVPVPNVSPEGQVYVSIIQTAVQSFLSAEVVASPASPDEIKALRVSLTKARLQ